MKGVVEVEGSGTDVLRSRSSFGGSSLRLRDARAKDCCPTPPLSGDENLSSLDTKSSEKKAPRSPSQVKYCTPSFLPSHKVCESRRSSYFSS